MHEGPRATRFRRRITGVLFVGYALFVAAITLTPQMPGTGTVSRVAYRLLEALHSRGVPLSVNYLTIEFIGNVLMFVPLGILLAMLLARRHWWMLLFAGTLMSAAIELSQLLFLPSRYPEVRDLISNTTGFLLGALAAILIRLLVAHRDTLVERDRQHAERSRRRYLARRGSGPY
ncbi:VanZ family protein [Salinibacterium sp. UTAS2018]|uniref:VanZ family protein n=1 Tax=Salinibacterium sp. UTAS2018 TaxID=2508880 RepID=UPI001009477C|nr:VanZ family protein [Salinibacterium sp. UTAS2018]QAV70543.1 VanZ family protein [Salinibacterium sp. UTAS2018]